MRILKYLFLLLILSLVALSIFVATQKGSFKIERSKIINSPKASIFNYVNDLKNWKDWNSLAVEDSLINISYSQNTIGNDSFCSWDGNQGYGDLKIINSKENDSILQKMTLDGNSADVIIRFKDTLGKTKVTWKAQGRMSFVFKIYSVFNGGAKKLFGTMFENSLNNLDKKLDYEINTYSIKVNGLANFQKTNYLAQSFTSEFSKVSKNFGIVYDKITHFCKKNNITISGKPFIIYHTYDTTNQLTKLSICIPIKNPIFLIDGSDLISKTLDPFQAVKTTLIGDYSHATKALNKTIDFINAKRLSQDKNISRIEVYTVGKNEINNPSKWITEIYYPMRSITVVKPATVIPTTTVEAVQKTTNEKEIPSEF